MLMRIGQEITSPIKRLYLRLPELETVQYKPIKVNVKNGNIEKALRQFKRKVKDSKLMLDIKNCEFYIKPSDKRREKRAKARLRAKKDQLNTNFF